MPHPRRDLRNIALIALPTRTLMSGSRGQSRWVNVYAAHLSWDSETAPAWPLCAPLSQERRVIYPPAAVMKLCHPAHWPSESSCTRGVLDGITHAYETRSIYTSLSETLSLLSYPFVCFRQFDSPLPERFSLTQPGPVDH